MTAPVTYCEFDGNEARSVLDSQKMRISIGDVVFMIPICDGCFAVFRTADDPKELVDKMSHRIVEA